MKRQMTAMMTGALLAISATTLPAFAKGSYPNTQPSAGGQYQTQVVATTGTHMHQQKWNITKNTEKEASAWITPSERARYRQFKAGIEQGLSPIQAAKKVGITKVTPLESIVRYRQSTSGEYQQRTSGKYHLSLSLSQKTVVTFEVNNRSKVVEIVRVCDARRLVCM